ncbi:hypothetical protein PO124_23805 [Bacillus licheniformis]|nr:hypothetical protein [Bacillus licheniformis]
MPEPVSLKRAIRIRSNWMQPAFQKRFPLTCIKIQTYCNEHNISVLSLFLSILHIYMHRVTGQKTSFSEHLWVTGQMQKKTDARDVCVDDSDESLH